MVVDAHETPDANGDRPRLSAKPSARLRSGLLGLIDRICLIHIWACLFKKLGGYTPLRLLGRKSETINRSYGWVDLWVAVRLSIPVLLLLVGAAWDLHWPKLLVLLLGACSILEVLVVQVNVVLLGGYWAEEEGEKQEVKSVHRLLVNALHNYAEVVAWFALFYQSLQYAFEPVEQNVLPTVDFVNFSFVTMTSFGYPNLRPINTLGFLLTLAQSAIGLMMVLIFLAIIVSALPGPTTRDRVEE